MASSKNWALYATTRRLGTWREHRLAGARVRQIGVSLEFGLPHGWKANVHYGRWGYELHWAMSKDDWRMKDFFDHIMPPKVRAELTQARADVDAGRGYRWNPDREDGPSIPLATWRPDDPVQPDGWHHDGKRWVMDETGWARDRYGTWRYTKPGDIGWKELDDGSWKYLRADGSVRTV